MPSPFTLSPNPTWMYLTPALHGTLEKIRFAIRERQGLCCIMGDVGLGKSTVLRYLVSEYQAHESEKYLTAWIPKGSFPSQFALLKAICEDFDLPPKRSLNAQSKAFEDFLVAQYQTGTTVVVFIDEAQMLSSELLELIRILLNFETDYQKLLQIVMAGQLDLRDRILLKKNKALRSRIFAPALLNTLSLEETAAMIQFRCDRAGVSNPFVAADVLERIYSCSNGVPRDVLRVCFHAWNLMSSFKLPDMDTGILESAIQEASIQAEGISEAEAAAAL